MGFGPAHYSKPEDLDNLNAEAGYVGYTFLFVEDILVAPTTQHQSTSGLIFPLTWQTDRFAEIYCLFENCLLEQSVIIKDRKKQNMKFTVINNDMVFDYKEL